MPRSKKSKAQCNKSDNMEQTNNNKHRETVPSILNEPNNIQMAEYLICLKCIGGGCLI